MLDVSHLSETYIVDNGDDYHALKDTANMFHIAVPNIIIYSFENPLIDEAEQIPGYASLPVPVINILLEYGKNFIVSISLKTTLGRIWKFTLTVLYLTNYTISTSISIYMFIQ